MPANEPIPIIYILHGDNDFDMARHVEDLCAGIGTNDQASLNITHLDGRNASLEEISTAAATLSFFDSGRRLVILSNPLAKLGRDKKAQERFCSLMEYLPPSTCLVLLINDQKERGDWLSLPDKKPHWLKEWIKKAGGRARLKRFELPRINEMPGIIIKQAKELKGDVSPEAARLLATHTGSDTRLAYQEVNKLLTYVNFKRPVELEDVQLLSIEGGPLNIFDLVDALGMGNHKSAMRLLHGLMEQQEPSILFSMVARQFRLLLLAREILDEKGGPSQVEKELGMPGFLANKLCTQAKGFSMSQLEAIYRKLCKIDLGFKTGEMPLEVALDEFIAGLGKPD